MLIPNFYKPRMVQYDYDQTNKSKHRNPKKLYKFGQTSCRDVEERYSQKFHDENNFRGINFGRDYDIRCLWSASFPTYEMAVKVESTLLQLFSYKNLWLDEDYNGVTETRLFTDNEVKMINYMLHNSAPSSDHKWKDGYTKAYFCVFTSKIPEVLSNDAATQLTIF